MLTIIYVDKRKYPKYIQLYTATTTIITVIITIIIKNSNNIITDSKN